VGIRCDSEKEMKWRTNPYRPEEGHARIRRKFAWFPVEIGDHTYWLESYQVKEVYTYRKRATKFGPIACLDWDEVERVPLVLYP
jgi:hypothetical protein